MVATLNPGEEAQLAQTIEMFEVITQSQPNDYQSLEILKEAYLKVGRESDAINASKRIAQAYVNMGQLSSAILEYETILQRHPEDPDVQTALSRIETQAATYPIETAPIESPAVRVTGRTAPAKHNGEATPPDDGRAAMHKIYVDGKLISPGDFDLCWSTPHPTAADLVDPFIQVLADKGIYPIEKSLKLLSDKSRVAFIPLSAYDIDIDLARNFPRALCRRWCIFPFDRMSKSVFLATANPFNTQAAREAAAATSSRVLWYLAPPSELVRMLRRAFH